MPKYIRVSIIVVLIVATVASAIFGAILPFLRAQRYISAAQTIGSVRSLEEFEAKLDTVFNFYAPVGEEELPKFVGNEILNILNFSNPPEPVARRLVAYMEPKFDMANVRHLMILARYHFTLWQRFGEEPEDLARAEEALLKAHNIGPKLPTPLYALLEVYIQGNKPLKAQETARKILALWPDDTRVQNSLNRLNEPAE